MVCTSCGSELRPGSKFCSECGSAVATACAHCTSPLEPGDRFCAQCGTPVSGAASGAGEPVVLPPTADPGQRRVVSVLFVDLVGFTPLTESRDSEEVRAMLTRYFDRAQDVVGRFGGMIEKYIGDAVMAVWGAKVTQEDDAERAVRAGLELVDAVRALGKELGLEELDARAGILTGEAMVGGGGNDSTGMVVGDIVNAAARLQSIADPGAVLVGDRTRELTGRSIHYVDAGTHTVKGRAEPISCWQALRVVAGRRGEGKSEALIPPFVGRHDEFRLVKDQFHAAGREGRVRLVSLIGQGGIGKSRLVEELRHYVDGLAERVYWHQGRSPSYGDGLNYWAIGEMIRRRCGIAETDNDQKTRTKLRTALAEYIDDESDRTWLEPRLSGLLGVAETPNADRNELFAAWRTFFEWVARRGPTVMIFEDAQWADEGTLAFIEDLVVMGTQHPIFVMMLARPDLLQDRSGWVTGHTNTITLHLAPLSDVAVRELVGGVVPSVSSALADRIVERAAGIPLFAVEFLRALAVDGALQREGDEYVLTDPDVELVLPDSLRGVVGARIDQLSEDERDLLQAAAILGHSFTSSALAQLMDRTGSDLERALEQFIRRDLLEFDRDPRSPERGQYRFVQSVIREVAHDRIPRALRKTRHLQVARYYTSLGVPELAGAAATHYLDALEAAGEDDAELRDEAVTAIEHAARRAAELGSHAQAMTTALQGVEISRDQASEVRLLTLAASSAGAGLQEGATELGERAVERARSIGDSGLLLEAATSLARIHGFSGKGHLIVDVLEPILAENEGDTARHAHALSELARGYMFARRLDDNLATVDRALTIAERLDLVQVIASAMNTRGTTLATTGRPREGRALLEASRRLAEDHDLSGELRRALNNLSFLANADRPRSGLELAKAQLDLARRVKTQSALFDALENVAGYLEGDGDWDEADVLLAEMEAMDLPEVEALLLEDHRRFRRMVQGDPEGALDQFQELASAVGEVEIQLQNGIQQQIGQMEFYLGRVEEAFDRWMAIDDVSTNLHDVFGSLHAAMYLRDRKRLAAVRARFDTKVFRGRFVDSFGRLIDAAAVALDGEPERAGAVMVEIMAEWDDLFFRLWTAEMRAECARLVGVDHEAGRRLVSDALEALTDMGATTPLELLGDTFAELGATQPAAG